MKIIMVGSVNVFMNECILNLRIGLNKSRFVQLWHEKERRHVKCGLWIIKSFQDFEV